jgi:hypothetical protein
MAAESSSSPIPDQPGFIPPHGNYEELLSHGSHKSYEAQNTPKSSVDPSVSQ